MDKIIQYGNFTPIGKHKNKRQIILCHTSRDVEEYLTSLKFRYNKKYDKIPHFVISRTGKILQLLPENTFSNFFDFTYMNKNSVIICLENLGWLEKKPLTNHHINWKGSIYNEPPYEKKWRDYFFWQPYTEEQVNAALELCKKLCEELSISKKCSGHNTKIEGIENFDGVVSRSNFDSRFTDLSPSFDFENFKNKLEYE
jgi:N-acetyl-anhydromuramyl-L-alanine amidase AmpD